MGRRVHIAVAEPSIIIRSGIVAVLKRLTSLSIDVVEIPSIVQLSQQLCRYKPDILIVDPSHLGVFSLQHVKDDVACTDMKFIALHNNLTSRDILSSYDEIVSVYDTVEQISDKLTKLINGNEVLDTKQELSVREKEIVICIVKGMSNKQIADTLSLSMHTIMTHRKNITNKLQIHSPSGLTIYALANKLIDFEDVKNLFLNEK